MRAAKIGLGLLFFIGGIGELCPQREQVLLGLEESIEEVGVAQKSGGQANHGVKLVDLAVERHALGILAHPVAVKQGGCAVITSFGIDFQMLIHTFPVGVFQCNCTVVADPATGDAIVIDPGEEGERIVAWLDGKGLKARYLIHSHAHLDHIGATKFVKQKTGGEICLHKEDLFLYDNIAMQSQLLGMALDPEVLPVDHYIVHGDVLECHAGLRTLVLHTPGHTPGSVCFLFDGMKIGGKELRLLCAGDTLFAGSIGRTDLWGGDFDQIIASIRERLLTLPGETVVIPGHGPQTTIAREKMSNPFVA